MGVHTGAGLPTQVQLLASASKVLSAAASKRVSLVASRSADPSRPASGKPPAPSAETSAPASVPESLVVLPPVLGVPPDEPPVALLVPVVPAIPAIALLLALVVPPDADELPALVVPPVALPAVLLDPPVAPSLVLVVPPDAEEPPALVVPPIELLAVPPVAWLLVLIAPPLEPPVPPAPGPAPLLQAASPRAMIPRAKPLFDRVTTFQSTRPSWLSLVTLTALPRRPRRSPGRCWSARWWEPCSPAHSGPVRCEENPLPCGA